MAGKEVSGASRLMGERPPGPKRDAARRDFVAANREQILAGLLDAADPNVPPTDEEILGLILGDIALFEWNRNRP